MIVLSRRFLREKPGLDSGKRKTYSLMWNRAENYVPIDFPYGTEKHLRIR